MNLACKNMVKVEDYSTKIQQFEQVPIYQAENLLPSPSYPPKMMVLLPAIHQCFFLHAPVLSLYLIL
jgi:hypothetical protein